MFYLNFQGRVTVASVKNFQIIHRGEVDYVIMQFGKVGPNAFSLDVRYPMSCVQALGIVISRLDHFLSVQMSIIDIVKQH